MSRLKIPDDVPIEAGMVTKAVANAQRQVESINFDRRKNVLKYDDVLNEQRKIVYGQRQRLLDGDEEFVAELGQRYLVDAVAGIVAEHCPAELVPEDWDLEGLQRRLAAIHDGAFDVTAVDLESVDHDDARRPATEDLLASYARASRRSAARRSCARSSAASSSPSSTGSGASTSTRWTRCATASVCGRSVSATR
jgi:preprotein translocase subunit SecA